MYKDKKKDIIAIDLGGTSAKVGIITPDGTIKNKWNIETDISNNGKNIVPNIIESIHKYLSKNELDSNDFLGIGMGSPGSVNRRNGTVIGAFNLNWKTLQPVKKQFEEATKIDFYLDNDANVAALGEQWKGAGDNEKNVVFMTIGTGVGGGIIVDGHLLHGADDAAGEIGHMTVSTKEYEYQCTCGKTGCLETVASATGIVHIAKDMMHEYDDESSLTNLYHSKGSVNAKDVFEEAMSGDQLAMNIVDKVCDFLSFACGNIANILNPSTIILGGGVSKSGEFLAEKVRRGFKAYAFPAVRDETKIKIAQLQNDAGVIGASSLVISETNNELKL